MAQITHSALLNILLIVYFCWFWWPCNDFLPIHFSYKVLPSSLAPELCHIPASYMSLWARILPWQENPGLYDLSQFFQRNKGTPAPLCPREKEKGNSIPVDEVVGAPWDVCKHLGRDAWVPLGRPWSTGNQKGGPSASVGGIKIMWKTTQSIFRAGKRSQWGGYFIWVLLGASERIGLRRKVGKQTA